jgi:hypothetical protein
LNPSLQKHPIRFAERQLGRHLVGLNPFPHQTSVKVVWNDGRALLAAAQQSIARGEIEFSLRLGRTMAFDAVPFQQGSDLLLPSRCWLLAPRIDRAEIDRAENG